MLVIGHSTLPFLDALRFVLLLTPTYVLSIWYVDMVRSRSTYTWNVSAKNPVTQSLVSSRQLSREPRNNFFCTFDQQLPEDTPHHVHRSKHQESSTRHRRQQSSACTSQHRFPHFLFVHRIEKPHTYFTSLSNTMVAYIQAAFAALSLLSTANGFVAPVIANRAVASQPLCMADDDVVSSENLR